MREELEKLDGKRRKFKATFCKYGTRSSHGHTIYTLLLLNVTDVLTHKIVTEHLWFTIGKRWKDLGLKEGDVVEFEARVDKYFKGYIQDEWDYQVKDYHLEYPTNIKKLTLEPNQQTLIVSPKETG